jgi:lipopolysaccharide export system permease protein
MKVVYRYIVKDFFKYFLPCLGVLVFIYIIINLFDNLGKYLAKNVLVVDIFLHYVYLMPSYIVLLIPIASIMAVFLVFGTMTKHKELLALKTSGLNVNHLFSIIFVIGAFLVVFTFVFQETVGVWAQTQKYEHQKAKIDKRPQRPKTRRSNFFYHGENNWVYHIRRLDAVRHKMDGVILWQISQDNKIQRRLDANYGLYDSIWVFHSVTEREFDSLGNETVMTYAEIDMPELQEKPQDFLKRLKPLEEMNVFELDRFVKKKRRAGENVAEEEVEFNYRFSYPIITLILLLITLPLSVVLRRGGIAIGLGLSVAMAFIYWGLIQSFRAYGVAGVMNPLVALWFPNILFAVIGIVLMLKVPR